MDTDPETHARLPSPFRCNTMCRLMVMVYSLSKLAAPVRTSRTAGIYMHDFTGLHSTKRWIPPRRRSGTFCVAAPVRTAHQRASIRQRPYLMTVPLLPNEALRYAHKAAHARRGSLSPSPPFSASLPRHYALNKQARPLVLLKSDPVCQRNSARLALTIHICPPLSVRKQNS